MKTIRKISKEYYVRQIMASWLAFYMLFFLAVPVRVTMATPEGGVFTVGEGVINPVVGGDTTVVVNQAASVIEWGSPDSGGLGGIDTSPSESLSFSQIDGLSNSAVLNRIMSGNTTQFEGALNGVGMRIFIVNPAGIIFGEGATVNVTQLVASSLKLANNAFINGLNTGQFQFTDGVNAQNVTNEGSISAERIALIGKEVINSGTLVANNGYVVLAAGNTVILTENGSNVSVAVEMPAATDEVPEPDIHAFKVNNSSSGDGIEAYGENAQVVLAAGDVWSAALVKAYSDGGSDAVATVDITAVGGNVNIEDDVIAEAVGDGVGGFNAIAAVTITAGGDVCISAKNDDTTVKAVAYDGVLNQANIEITGQNVNIKSENYGGFLDLLSPDDALIEAYAHDGSQNTANVTITATGDVESGGDVTIESVGEKGDDVLVKAEAKNGEENTAGIDITATGNVEVISYGLFDEVLVQAEAWNEIELTPEIPPDFVIEIIDDVEVEVPQEAIVDLTVEGLVNTATVDITAGGYVHVIGESSGDAGVKAVARNDIDVDIDNYDNPVTVNLTVADLENNAAVTINANGNEDNGDVSVGAYGASSKVGVSAEAYNELEFEQNTGGYDWVKIEGRWTKVYRDSYAATLNLDVSSLENNANIDITANNGNVEVGSEECWLDSEAKMEALAWNDTDIDIYCESTGNLTFDDLTNNAGIDITATSSTVIDDEEVCGGNVEVLAENGAEAGIKAQAWNELNPSEDASGIITASNIANNADVTIDADGSVKVKAECEGDCSESIIAALAYNEGDAFDFDFNPENITNTANVDITAGEDVKVIGKYCGDAYILADTWLGTENISGVTINTLDGDVLVLGVNGDASIEATAEEGIDNTATIGINAVGGDVKVIDIGEGGDDTAKIEASAEEAYNSNTADVTINATATTSEYEFEGEVYLEVDGGDVKVIAKDGGDAAITAFAADAGGPRTNTANVTINATAAQGTEPEPVFPEVNGDLFIAIGPIGYEAVPYTDGGDVKVKAECGGKAEIEAIAMQGQTNIADVLICIDGGVKVEGSFGGEAEIEALAIGGYDDSINTASVGIGAKGEDGVEVIADRGGEAGISSKAKDGYINTASTIVCTQGGIDVIAQRGGDAEIVSQAKDGHITDAFVGVCAVGDIVVQAGQENELGCEAGIRAEAESYGNSKDTEPSSANAQTVVVSHEGSVEVLAFNGGEAEILADAQGGHTNTADVGVAAGADLSPSDVALPDEVVTLFSVDGFGPLPLSGNVIVKACGEGSEAQILARAHDAYPIYVEVPGVEGPEIVPVPGENTADTVICAPGEVRVTAYDGDARIKSWAGGWGEDGSINTATTQVYASEVKVDVPDRRGNGITAWAVDSGKVTVPDSIPDDGRLTYCMTENETVAVTDGTSTLIIDTYANRKDCPTCPPCPCEQQAAAAAVTPPLPQIRFPEASGCPVLMGAVASELGVPTQTIQIAFAGATSVAPNIQPCYACEGLVSYAEILKDADGSHMAALAQIFNTLAPPDAPFTPEMGSAIAAAFAENFDNPDMPQYAMAMEYIDAFTGYVSVLDDQMGSPVGDSAAFVMGKYGEPLTASNPNMTAYVQMQIAEAQGI